MNEIWIILMQIVETPGMAFRIGMMIATAIFIGFVIVENYHMFIKIIMAILVLIFFQEWMRVALISSVSTQMHPTTMAVYATTVSLFFFSIGIAIGAALGINARRKEECIQKAGEDVFSLIDNGGLGGDSIDKSVNIH